MAPRGKSRPDLILVPGREATKVLARNSDLPRVDFDFAFCLATDSLLMADFKTHITTSTVVGIGYGAAGYALGMPLDTSMLAAGLCSLAGILPDLDSDSGIPLRETIAFSAAVTPMLMVDRFRHMGMSDEGIVLAGGLIYLFIRFGLARIFKRYTVHRGMWHSLPAAAIFGCLAFMICSCEDGDIRRYKAGAAVLGFLVHLGLDELWSIEMRRGRIRFKSSFGTAMKFWGKRGWANFSTYAKLVVVMVMAFGDPILMEYFEFHHHHPVGHEVHETASNVWHDLLDRGKDLLR